VYSHSRTNVNGFLTPDQQIPSTSQLLVPHNNSITQLSTSNSDTESVLSAEYVDTELFYTQAGNGESDDDQSLIWMDLDKLGNLFSHEGSNLYLRIGALGDQFFNSFLYSSFLRADLSIAILFSTYSFIPFISAVANLVSPP
jgi:hypothetical protein